MTLPPEEEAAIRAIKTALKGDQQSANHDVNYIAKEDHVHKLDLGMDMAMAHHFKYGNDIKIKKNDIRCLPAEIGNLAQLDSLIIDFPTLGPLPDEIAGLKRLKYLVITSMALLELPDAIGKLENLEELRLHCNSMTTLPASIGNLKNLKKVHIGKAPAKFKLPETLLKCTNLESIGFQDSQINALPDFLINLPNLKKILLIDVNMDKFPRNIGKFPHLESLLFRTPLKNPKEIELNVKLNKLGRNEYGEITGEALKYLKAQFK